MAALPGSGQISFGDIATNHGIASSNVSLKTESEALASGSVVDGSELQTTARYNLKAAPYAISEFMMQILKIHSLILWLQNMELLQN